MRNAKSAAPQRLGPGFPPVAGPQSRVLILGSFPSPKSREQAFYYGHPQNRFWPMLAAVLGETVPEYQNLEAKQRLILSHRLALWDTVRTCTITGASDASIRDAEPNPVWELCRKFGIGAVICNGAASGRVYTRYALPHTGIPAIILPSTSPANAAWSLPRLQKTWQEGLKQAFLAAAEPAVNPEGNHGVNFL